MVSPQAGWTPSGGVTLRFDNAEIYDVIQVILGDILRVDYVIDPSVQGRITIKSTEAVSPADIFNVLESALAMSNISIVRQGKTYRVTRDANAVRDVITGDPAGPGSPLLQVIPVRFVQASQLVNTLRNFIGPQAAITNDPTNKYLIVADRAANVAKILDMVKVLDVDYLDKVRVRKSGLSHLVDIQVRVDGDLSVREGHDIAHAVKDALIASARHAISDVAVHIEPMK